MKNRHRNRSPEPAGRTMVAAWLFCLCLLGSASGGFAGQPAETAVKPDMEKIRRELLTTYRRVADRYIAEQPAGRSRAQVTLIVGGLYETGRMGETDAVVAAQYYQKAAETGLTEAKFALGNVYNSGAESATGHIERDPAKARGLFEEAAEAGSVPAMVALGIIYSDGMNVNPDSKKALHYLMEAGKRADPTALDRLEPIMRKAREWEEAKPGRKGKANFPTSQEDLIDPKLVQEFIDNTFDLDRFASSVYVEINRRIKEATTARTK